MKMIVAILQDDDAESVSQALIEAGMTVTRIASTGGFLRQGRSTLMVGAEKEKVDDVIKLIDKNCAPSIEPMHKKATLFVLNVEHFEQI
ncbi:MAG: cyclic-di-AMP receptor [Chloroflexi bacterium]|nr:cyclic-di-AMP receptor [Chloroflexota bacterium]MBU1662685.1 cyclic-di-AMP receptor [Chloroflexota bacterium]